MNHYGTLVDANAFFASRLFTYDWDLSSVENREKALVHATMLIDQFDYVGQKYTVQAVINAASGSCPNEDDLQQAELAQPLQFPRGNSSAVPHEVEKACYLIAQSLLSGRNPDMDLEALAQNSISYGGLRAGYDRSEIMEHVTHLIPSAEAFNLLRPFFRRRNTFEIKRV